MNNLFPNLNFTVLRFEAVVTNTIILPPGFIGIWLRNSIGNILNKTLTATDYSFIWDAKLPGSLSSALSMGSESPRGYIIEPPLNPKRKYETGERFEFNIIFIGLLKIYIPQFIYALQLFESEFSFGRKAGHGKGNFRLIKITSGENNIYNPIEGFTGLNLAVYNFDSAKVNKTFKEVILNFITPARIFLENYPSPVILNRGDDFKNLMYLLSHRLMLMEILYCTENIKQKAAEEPEKLKQQIDELNSLRLEMIEKSSVIKLKNHNLTWVEVSHIKKSKNPENAEQELSEQKFGGFTGELTFTGDITPFIPMLILGEHLHVGRDYVYGLGKYEIL